MERLQGKVFPARGVRRRLHHRHRHRAVVRDREIRSPVEDRRAPWATIAAMADVPHDRATGAGYRGALLQRAGRPPETARRLLALIERLVAGNRGRLESRVFCRRRQPRRHLGAGRIARRRDARCAGIAQQPRPPETRCSPACSPRPATTRRSASTPTPLTTSRRRSARCSNASGAAPTSFTACGATGTDGLPSRGAAPRLLPAHARARRRGSVDNADDLADEPACWWRRCASTPKSTPTCAASCPRWLPARMQAYTRATPGRQVRSTRCGHAGAGARRGALVLHRAAATITRPAS